MNSPCDGHSLKYFDEDNGNLIWLISSTGSFSVGSDSRRKCNINTIMWENVLEKICNIKPSTFNMKRPESCCRETSKWDQLHIGLIAQNVQENFPELVTEDHSTPENYLIIQSSWLVLPVIQGIKELVEENKKMKDEMMTFMSELTVIKQRLTNLENSA